MRKFVDQLRQHLIETSQELGIKKFDLYGVISEDQQASSKDGTPFLVSASQKTRMTIRVWNKEGMQGIIRSSNVTPEGLKEALELASVCALKIEDQIDFSDRAKEPLESSEEKIEMAPISSLISAVTKAEKHILEDDNCFKSVPYNKVSESLSSVFYINSDHVYRFENLSSSACYFYPMAESHEKKARQEGELSFARSFKDLDVEDCWQTAVKNTKEALHYKQIGTGKYLIVFGPDAFLSLIKEFGNFFNAQNILDKKSLVTESSLSQPLSSPLLSIEDNPFVLTKISGGTFDQEGTPYGVTTILDKGILSSFLHSSVTAKKLKQKITGNTVLGSKLGIQENYLVVKRGETPSEERDLLTEEKLIYIKELNSLHAGINALQGSFSLPFSGSIYEKGKKTSIEGATVAGDFLTLLKDIIFVGQQSKETYSGLCPDVWVKDLSVTGLQD